MITETTHFGEGCEKSGGLLDRTTGIVPARNFPEPEKLARANFSGIISREIIPPVPLSGITTTGPPQHF
jgi:hypothetical protein